MKTIRLISLFVSIFLISSCALTTEPEKPQSEQALTVASTTETTTDQTTSEAISSVTTTLPETTTTEAVTTARTTAETLASSAISSEIATTAETTTSETTTTATAVTMAEAITTTVEAVPEYNEVGYGNFLSYKAIYPKPEDETNPTGGYIEYLNIDGIIYRYCFLSIRADTSSENSAEVMEKYRDNEFFAELVEPCFEDGELTFEKLRGLPVIGCGESQCSDVIPLEDFRTQDGDLIVYRLSDKAVMTIYERNDGATNFNFWERSEKATEFCRIGRLLWEISEEYEISRAVQLVYMYTDKPDVLEIDAPEEYHEEISGYLEENNISAELFCFSRRESAEEPNPGMKAMRYVVIGGEHYYPFPASSLMLELDDGFYDYWNSGVPVKRYRDCVRRNVCIDDIINNYEPVGTAVYTEKPENEFETNLKEYGGADIYFFSEGYTFDFLGNGGNEICALLIAAEPAYIVDGQEFYQYVEVDYNQYENNH